MFISAPWLRRILKGYATACAPSPARFTDAPLFRSQKGRHLTPTSMSRLLKDLYRDAGIPNASSHSGRRTLITGLAERGVDLKAIAQIAGHASIRTTAGYVETNPVRLSRILQEVSW